MSASDEDTFFTFTWKIENVSLYAEDIDAELSSPSFKIGTTAEFQMYLTSGDWPKKDIRLRVLRRTPHFLLYWKSELSLLRADGEVIERRCQGGQGHIDPVGEYQIFLFLKPTLFSNKRVLQQFLPQNTLIIRWKVYGIASGECFFRTVFHYEDYSWKIQEFSKHQNFPTRIIKLSSQYITTKLTKLNHNIIIAKFITSNQRRLHFGNCAIVAVDEERNTVYRYGKVNVIRYKKFPPKCFYDGNEVNVTTDQYWEAPVLLDEFVCTLIKNDTLYLKWEFTVGISEVWNNVKSNALEQVSPITLRSDLMRLYEDRKFCDATLETDTSSSPVHKTVLCARSPVFCAMFDSDTEEGRTGIVRISDIGQDTVDRMLRFLYTDNLGDDIPWEVAAELYYAADKYHIQILKDKCVSVIVEKMSVENACETLVLADTHQDEDLMQAVKDFVVYHDEVIKSVQWKELEKENPSLTVQFFREMSFKKKKYH